jgi:hypothetical protein
VITSGWLAGENVEASFALLPAAATYTTPAPTELLIALSIALEVHSQPRLMLATLIVEAFLVTQSMPATIPPIEPLPLSLRTLTACSRAPRRHAHDTAAVVASGDGAGNVRAVAVLVGAANLAVVRPIEDVPGRLRAVHGAGEVEVWMCCDPRVQDRDVDVHELLG